MDKEIEAKFLNIDKIKVRKDLKKLGFKLLHPERLMKRKAFHFEDDVKNKRSRWARVRDEGNKITLCVKEVTAENDINAVFESEIVIDTFEKGARLLKSLGMDETSYQETYREEWVKDEEGVHIAIDTWPHLKPFLEIEAQTEETVKLYAKKLGFDFADAMFGGTDEVYNKVLNIPKEMICRVPKITFDLELEEMLSLLE